MKRNLKVLALIPVFALAACANLGKEVDEQAAQAYTLEMAKVEEPKNMTFSIEMSGSQKEDGKSVSYKVVIKTKKAENGDVYTYVLEKQANAQVKVEYYQVKNAKYEEVTYVSTSVSGQATVKQAYTKKDNAAYETLIEDAEEEFGEIAASYNELLSTPENALQLMEGDTENITMKYYSNGEKNLSIKASMRNGKPSSQEESEYAVSGDFLATYNDYRFASISSTSKSNLGSVSVIKASASYGKVSIGLPSGWEKALATLSV